MNTRQRRARLAPALAALALCLAAPAPARAQDEDAPPRPPAQRRDEVNHEIHLYLLAAGGGDAARGELPESLGGVVRQLRATLPAASYRVAMTLVHRVRDGGGGNFRGVGAPHLAPPAGPHAPATFGYQFSNVKLTEDAAGAKFVHFRQLNFNSRVPVQTGTANGAPIVQYEETGLSTELSVREGEPTLVGTITTSRPDELYVLVVNVRRAGQQGRGR